jgi:hypothetical protein
MVKALDKKRHTQGLSVRITWWQKWVESPEYILSVRFSGIIALTMAAILLYACSVLR